MNHKIASRSLIVVFLLLVGLSASCVNQPRGYHTLHPEIQLNALAGDWFCNCSSRQGNAYLFHLNPDGTGYIVNMFEGSRVYSQQVKLKEKRFQELEYKCSSENDHFTSLTLFVEGCGITARATGAATDVIHLEKVSEIMSRLDQLRNGSN